MRSPKDPVIVTCAVTGNAPFNPAHPSFPVSPEQICAAVVEAAREGELGAQAALLDAHVRVGLEDNLYLGKGQFATNGQLVECAHSIVEGLGYRVATPLEARQMLNIAQAAPAARRA